MKKFILLLALVTGVFLVGTSPPKADALTGSEFQAGRIIDDSVFFNGNTLDAQTIQSFLNSKVPVCDTNGTQAYGGTSRATYAASRGYSTPFTCLKDYSQDTPTKAAEAGLCSQYNGGTKSAAQIIYDIGVACGVSQRALIVLLEKEQSLITDDWPWSVQYRSATGYGCPDTAPCDAEYYGFFNQVYNAARQFKKYARDESSFRYRAYRDNYIQYNPNAGCGGTNVYIQNRSTAALYNYTPYQPNPSALANLQGSGDSCGAYGNRNFWRLYNSWFGSTLSDRPITNMPWTFENLAGGNPTLSATANTVGITPKTVTFNNELYVFHYDSSLKVLKLAKAGASGWTFQTLDGDSTANGRVVADVGRSVTTATYNNMLHIFYYNTTNSSMRHGWYSDGAGWNFENLDGNASSVSGAIGNVGMSNVALEFDGELNVFYYDGTRNNLRNAKYSTTLGWRFQNLDGDYGSIAGYNSDVGQNPTSAIITGSLQLFYYDAGNGNLRHAWVNPGQSWKFENLDGDYGSVARNNANVGQDPTIVEHFGSLQLFYYDAGNGNLRHAWVNPGQSWKFENLDGDYGSIGRFNGNVGSMANSLSFNNTLYVFYRDNSSGTIRYTWADSAGWHFAALEGNPSSASGVTSNTGFWPTATSYGDSVQLFYFDNSQRALRHAFGIPYL